MGVTYYPDGSYEFTDDGNPKSIRPNCSDCGKPIGVGERAIHVEKTLAKGRMNGQPFETKSTNTSHAGCAEGKYRYDAERRLWVA